MVKSFVARDWAGCLVVTIARQLEKNSRGARIARIWVGCSQYKMYIAVLTTYISFIFSALLTEVLPRNDVKLSRSRGVRGNHISFPESDM
jgi:hypothetical protein